MKNLLYYLDYNDFFIICWKYLEFKEQNQVGWFVKGAQMCKKLTKDKCMKKANKPLAHIEDNRTSSL